MNTLLCPACRNPIPPDAPGGICPSCALLGVAQPTVIMPPAGTPSREEITVAFPDLEVMEVIGQGGMGVVFKARQPRLDRLVALKILPPHLAAQPGFIERFTREARALAKLNHPHIVAVYDFGESGGFCYLVMEYVNGVNLRQAMRAGVKPEQAMLLVPRICEALQFAHDRGVLHRDIKPENILLDTAGTPKLADFGIAKLAGDPTSGLTLSGATLGTASYMAPEQIEKPATVDHRADIYSLGVVFYEMLTGELPIGRFAAPSHKSKVGEGVDEVVMRALEKERELRQQSATEMKTQVEGVSSGTYAAPAVEDEAPEPFMKRLLLILTALAGIGIPASAVMPGAASMGIKPAVMVFVCAALGTLYGMWPDAPRRRRPVPGVRMPVPASSPEERRPRTMMPRGFLAIALTLLFCGAGLFVFKRFLSPRMGQDGAGSYQTGPPVDVVQREREPFVGNWEKGSVELVAVSEHPSGNSPRWRMDGRGATEGPFTPPGGEAFRDRGERAYEFVIHLRDMPEGASSPVWLIEHVRASAGGGSPALKEKPDAPLPGYFAMIATLPDSIDRTNIKVGVAFDEWESISESAPGNFGARSFRHGGVDWKVTQGTAIETKEGDLVVSFTASRPADWESRVVAVDTAGKEITTGGGSRMNDHSEWRFPGLTLSAVKEFRFQVRRVRWVEFRGVSLAPAR